MEAKLRLVRNLLEKRHARHKEHLFVVEGPHLVEEAAGRIKFAVYCEQLPIVKQLEGQGVPAFKISRKQFAELTDVETPQGILAVVKEQKYELSDVLKSSRPLVVFCVEIQDPGNLGTIIRTADAAGASGILLSKGTVDLYNQKAIRSTMGSLFHLPIVQVNDIKETIEYLKGRKVKIIAADVHAQKDYFSADFSSPCAVLIGNEGTGLGKEIVDLADEGVKIPIPGKAESLNAAVSAAVILYEAIRQRLA